MFVPLLSCYIDIGMDATFSWNICCIYYGHHWRFKGRRSQKLLLV